jgi:hypothetical protein
MEKKKIDWDLVGWFAAIIIGIMVFGLIMRGGESVLKKVGNSTKAKDYCSKAAEVTSAKTDYAAKLAYKECIRNY